MRLLMLSDVFFPRVNGVSTSIQTFATSFLTLGHEVTLVAPRYPAAHEAAFEVLRVPSRRLPLDPEDRVMSLSATTQLAGQLRTRYFDLVHIQTPFVAHYAGLRLARALRVPTIASYHTFFEAYFELYLPGVPKAWLRSLARHYSNKQCGQVDGIISPSHQMLARLREYGVTTQAAVIPTGLPLERFAPPSENRFRQRYAIPTDALVLLYVGRVAFEKNIEFLLAAFDRVRHKVTQAILVIAGEGPALTSLRQRAAQLRYSQDVRFLGYLERDTALIECYHASDLFVFASQTETQGLVLLEAMACGLPVISTANMGSKDVLREGQGCLIAPLALDPFVDRIRCLLSDPVKARAIAERGRAYVSQWSTEAKAQEMLAFYDRTLGRDTSRHQAADVPQSEVSAR